jgi:phosphoglycerol transferase MdoB-like AlkP superfamily enzyme
LSKPDVILLIVESLSSINSNKVSGRPGFLGGFDKLAEEGVLFRNFFANHQASEGGLIALLGGFPPVHFPTATPYMFDEFAIQPSVLAEYRKQGYFTDFLTSADLGFIGLDHFLRGLGLDRSRGRDEVDDMRLAPRVVQDAPSDAYLYREALISIPQLMASRQPFFLTIATTSTHLPYSHPSGGPDTPEAVWNWSMEQLLSFYSQLSDNGFFDNGILLITGDHRQMRPLTEMETERYGGSARARVPLLVIGKDYQRGAIDKRFFQQSDLLRMLGKIQQPQTRLSPHPIWVERYNRKYGRIELINRLSVFDEADNGRYEHRLKVVGNRIEWLAEKPGFARQVELRIHTQRSLHQRIRNDTGNQAVQQNR